MTRPAIPKTTITVPQISVCGCGDSNPTRPVSVAAQPWGELPCDDRQATAPRVGAIRCARQWREDPVLRHASKRKDMG